MLGLYKKDYTVLSNNEIAEKEKIDSLGGNISGAKFGRRNPFFKYPKAVRHYMKLFPNNYLDIVDLKDEEVLNKQCDEFEELLNNKTTIESTVKSFIQNNEYYHIPASILKYYNFGHHDAFLFKEFSLGTRFRADYVIAGKSSDGYSFIFVEFENPYNSITINGGSFGETIRKGINQVEDWKTFIASNYSTITDEFRKMASQSLPDEFHSYDETRMNYVVVAGRRSDFNEKTRILRRRKFEESKIQILHYDNLLDNARSLIGCNTY